MAEDRSSVYHSWDEQDFDPNKSGWKRSRYEIKATGDTGFDSLRGRFLVVCKECNKVLHHNTTWPNAYIERHEKDHANKCTNS